MEGLGPEFGAPLVCPTPSALGTHLRQGEKLLLFPQHPSCPCGSPPFSALTTWPRKTDSEPAAGSRASGLDQEAAGSTVMCSLMSRAPRGHRRGRVRSQGEACWTEGKPRPGTGAGSASAISLGPASPPVQAFSSGSAHRVASRPGPVLCCLPASDWPGHPEKLTKASCPPSGCPAGRHPEA